MTVSLRPAPPPPPLLPLTAVEAGRTRLRGLPHPGLAAPAPPLRVAGLTGHAGAAPAAATRRAPVRPPPMLLLLLLLLGSPPCSGLAAAAAGGPDQQLYAAARSGDVAEAEAALAAGASLEFKSPVRVRQLASLLTHPRPFRDPSAATLSLSRPRAVPRRSPRPRRAAAALRWFPPRPAQNGNTPLHTATRGAGHLAVARLLIEKGALLEATDKARAAARGGCGSFAPSGSCPHPTPRPAPLVLFFSFNYFQFGQTALAKAVKHGHAPLVELLLGAGAHVEAPSLVRTAAPLPATAVASKKKAQET